MPTLLSGISVALQAMMASQQATRAIEQNVSNANTPGYHRQQAVFKATRAYPPAGLYTSSTLGGQVGAGVEVDTIERFNTDFLDASVRRETSNSAYWAGKADYLRTVESQMMEVNGSGLMAEMDAFWKGWSAIEADPTNTVLRTELIERTRSLADGFNNRVKQLNALRSDLDKRIGPLVDDINRSAEQVAELNRQILTIQASGNQPNDLIDQRGLLLEDLAKMAGATTHIQANGQALVSLGGHMLVTGGTAAQMKAVADSSGLLQMTWNDDDQNPANDMPVNFANSEIKAILEARDTMIPDQLSGLRRVTDALVARANFIHERGYGLNAIDADDNGKSLFDVDAAGYISLSADIGGPEDIAAALSPDSPGDGDNAAALAYIQYETILSADPNNPGDPTDPTDARNTLTLHAVFNSQVTRLGLDIKAADKNSSSRQLILDALEQQRQSISGVSLDEEAANLARYQRSYQAAARLMTAVDEMLDRVINGMGRVGL